MDPFLQLFTDFCAAVLPGIAIAVVSGAIGRACWAWIDPARAGTIGRAPLEIASGLSILIVAYSMLSVLHVLQRFSGSVLLVVLLVLFRHDCRKAVELWQIRFGALYRGFGAKRTRVLIAFLIAGTFGLGLIGLMAPSTGYDSTVYHLTLPKIYAEAGGFVPRPDIIQSRYPQGLSGLRAFCYQWGGEDSVEILNMIACILLLWWVIEFVELHCGTRPWVVWAVLIFFSSLQFIFYLYDAENEIWLSLLLACLFQCYDLLNRENFDRIFIAMGFLAGCLLNVKTTVLPAAAIILLSGFFRGWRYKKRLVWLPTLTAFLMALAIGGFWHVILFVIYYPLFADGGLIGMDIPFFAPDRLTLVRVWDCLKAVAFYNAPICAYLLLMPRSAYDRSGKVLCLVTFVTLVCVFFVNPWDGHAYVRYSYYIFPLTIWGVLRSLKRIEHTVDGAWKYLRAIAVAMVMIGLFTTQAANAYRNLPKVAAAFRFETRDSYLAKRVNTYETIQLANKVIPPGGRLLMVGERSLWLKQPYILGIERNPYIRFVGMTPERFFRLLEEQSITHLVFSNEPSDYTIQFCRFWDQYPEIRQDPALRLVKHDVWWSGGSVRDCYLYEVRPSHRSGYQDTMAKR